MQPATAPLASRNADQLGRRGCGAQTSSRHLLVERSWYQQNVDWFKGRGKAGIDNCSRESVVMLDFLMLIYGVGFFAIAILYGLACEKM